MSWLAVFVVTALLPPPSAFGQEPPSAETEQVEKLFAQALASHQAGDILGAIEGYKVVLNMDPSRGDARSNLGAAYVHLGRYDEAIDEYRKALERQEDASVRFNLALAFYKAGRVEEAAPEFRRVLESRDTPAAVLLLADCLVQAARFDDAIALLKPREQAFGEDLSFAYLLGTALLRTGDARQAEVFMDRIFKAGDSAEAHLLMGLAHLERRDYPAAAKELAQAAEMNPELPSVHALYGRALVGSSDREGAARALRRELARNPNQFEANLLLGNLYKTEQKHDDALVYLKRAAIARPDDPNVRLALATVHLGLDEAETALGLLEPLVKDVPDMVDAHVLLATTYYRLKRKEDGDRERQIVQRLNAEIQARQPKPEAAGGAGAGVPAAASPAPSPGEPQRR